MGAISDLIQRITGQSVARVALAKTRGATLKPAPLPGVAPVAPVTPEINTLQAPSKEVEIQIPVTRGYFAERGVHILAEDLAFLRWHLSGSTQSRNSAIGQYIQTWRLAAEAEPIPHRKENAGRFAANCWLRGEAS